jgi:hypothetical protein
MSDDLTEKIIGAAIEVHRLLGQGYWNPSTKKHCVWNSNSGEFLFNDKSK